MRSAVSARYACEANPQLGLPSKYISYLDLRTCTCN